MKPQTRSALEWLTLAALSLGIGAAFGLPAGHFATYLIAAAFLAALLFAAMLGDVGRDIDDDRNT